MKSPLSWMLQIRRPCSDSDPRLILHLQNIGVSSRRTKLGGRSWVQPPSSLTEATGREKEQHADADADDFTKMTKVYFVNIFVVF